jgi:hypothetical protein
MIEILPDIFGTQTWNKGSGGTEKKASELLDCQISINCHLPQQQDFGRDLNGAFKKRARSSSTRIGRVSVFKGCIVGKSFLDNIIVTLRGRVTIS